mgnify:CR=1 FL=1
MTKKFNQKCNGSHLRQPVTVDEECRKKALCPVCGRYLRINATRNAKDYPQGTPVATLPAHKLPN